VPQLLDAVEALSARSAALPPDEARPLARLQLELIAATLETLPASAVAERLRRERCRIDALLVSDRVDEGVERMQLLLNEFPNDGRLQRWGAARLGASGAAHRSAALESWRKVAARSAPQTDGWFEARYWVARLTAETGDRERSLQLLKYLQSIPPGWEEAPNREAFEQLLRQLER